MVNTYTAVKNLLVILPHSVVIDMRSYEKLYIGSFIERLDIKVGQWVLTRLLIIILKHMTTSFFE